MKEYDFVFSCGYSCAVTQALRAANLQFASFPFDWMATTSFKAAAQVVANDFAHWMDREDLELVDVRRGGIMKHIYRNRRNGFGFVHDFSSFETFDESYPKEAAKYARRIERMKLDLASAKKALAIYVEAPIMPRIYDEELAETKRIFETKYPGTEFELVYCCEDPAKTGKASVSTRDGITVIAADYRTFTEDGEVNHEMNNAFLIDYLKMNVRAVDPRTPEEKAKYAAGWEKQDKARWHGKNWFETLINRTAYRQYRKLERFLMGKGLIPKERPLWFVEPEEEA